MGYEVFDSQWQFNRSNPAVPGPYRGRCSSAPDGRNEAEEAIVMFSAWKDVLKRVAQVASTDATVCLQGESGDGREVVARFIHRRSVRTRGPFVAINCAALPDELLESELFGFERGAFTG